MKAAIIGPKITDTWAAVHKEIKDLLEEYGVNVDFSYFDTTTAQDSENLERTYRRNRKIIKDADIIIAETTQYSGGIGYLIADSLNEKKPVLALYNKDLGEKPSNIIKASSTSKFLSFSEYDKESLPKVIKKFLVDVKSMLDTKFILIISPEIDKYLEWAADYKRMHKAQVVRSAVEEMMEKDKEYKESMRGM